MAPLAAATSLPRVNAYPRWARAALSALCLATAVPAAAQTDEQRAGARAAAEAGIQAFEEGRFADAVDLFTRAEQLVHAPPHLLYAARAQTRLGNLVQAHELYIRIVRENLPENAPRAFREAQKAAEQELAEVTPRLAYVTIVVQGGNGAESLVTRDGTEIPAALVGVPHPVNPGQHTYQATANGWQSAPKAVDIKEGARVALELNLEPAPGAVGPGADKPTEAGGSAVVTKPDDERPPETSGSGVSGLKIGGFVTLGLGAVGLGAGTYFLVKGLDTRSDADELAEGCHDGEPCVQEVDELDDDAAQQQTIGVATLIGGGVLVGTGITLLLLDSGRSDTTAQGPSVRPVIGLGYAGLAGRF